MGLESRAVHTAQAAAFRLRAQVCVVTEGAAGTGDYHDRVLALEASVGQMLSVLLAGLVWCVAPAALSAQGNPASAPDTAEGMSRATDTTSTITPGVNDPASTADTTEGMSAETDTTSTITPGVRDPASTPDTAATRPRRTPSLR